MFAQWTVVFVIALVSQITFAVDDLLDQYVKHVGESNRNNTSTSSSGGGGVRRIKRGLQTDMLWTHSEVLDDKGDFVLRWQPRHQEIAFRVEARTKGYLGIGFSPNGGMKGADIVIGWVDDRNGQAYLLVS